MQWLHEVLTDFGIGIGLIMFLTLVSVGSLRGTKITKITGGIYFQLPRMEFNSNSFPHQILYKSGPHVREKERGEGSVCKPRYYLTYSSEIFFL